jgi:hypothetical protein
MHADAHAHENAHAHACAQAAYPDEVDVAAPRPGSDLLGFRFRACGRTGLDVCFTFPRLYPTEQHVTCEVDAQCGVPGPLERALLARLRADAVATLGARIREQ